MTHYVESNETDVSVNFGKDFGRAEFGAHVEGNTSEASGGLDVGAGNASLLFEGSVSRNDAGYQVRVLKGATLTLGAVEINCRSVRMGGNAVFYTPTFTVPQLVLKLEAHAADKSR